MAKNTAQRSSRHAGNSVFRPFPRDKDAWIPFGLFALAIVVLSLIYWFTGIGCVFRAFLHFPCPGCGMSRALVAFFKGNVGLAFRYHFMFPTVPLGILLILFNGKLFRKDFWNYALILLIFAGFAVRWILNLTGVLPA